MFSCSRYIIFYIFNSLLFTQSLHRELIFFLMNVTSLDTLSFWFVVIHFHFFFPTFTSHYCCICWCLMLCLMLLSHVISCWPRLHNNILFYFRSPFSNSSPCKWSHRKHQRCCGKLARPIFGGVILWRTKILAMRRDTFLSAMKKCGFYRKCNKSNLRTHAIFKMLHFSILHWDGDFSVFRS